MADNSRRPIRARERNFRFADFSKPQSRAPKDDRTLNRKGRQVEIVRPKWMGAAPMTFRPFPMTQAEDPSVLEPTRMSTDDYDFSDFWRGLPAVKYVGIDQKFTFLAYDPRRVHDEGYDPRKQNPYHVLFNAITSAVKSGEAIVKGRNVITAKWGPLVMEGAQKAFNTPTKMYFLQGAIYESDNENYVAEGDAPKGLRDGDLPQVIEISSGGGNKLARKLNKLNPEYQGDTDVEMQADMYLYGDIVDLTNGSFVTFFNPKKHSNVFDDFDDFSEEEETSGGFQSWDAAIAKSFQYVHRRQQMDVAPDISQYEDRIREQIVPWDDILYFPSHEEICMWMAQAFRSMPAILDFGWADNQEFFTNEVQGILSNRVQVQGASGEGEDEEVPFDVKPARAQKQRSATLSVVVPPPEEEEEGEYNEDVQDDLEEDDVTEEIVAVTDDTEDDDEDDEYDEVEAEEAALAAMERSKNRTAVRVGPSGPPSRATPAPTAKAGKATTKVAEKEKAKVTSKPTPSRRNK